MYAIAIDGPSGSGKSSIARALAARLNILYVDTGAMYRGICLYMLQNDIPPNQTAEVAAALQQLSIDIRYEKGQQHILLNGVDVNDQIRSEDISRAASKYAILPCVRAFLRTKQTELAAQHSLIMDGRDIGTVVLPNAQVKLFLTASAEERARRRYQQILRSGEAADYDTVLADITERDNRDQNRRISPTVPADDAIVLDSTTMTKEQTIEKILNIIHEKTREAISCDSPTARS